MKAKRILGVDPGSRVTGVGIIDFIEASQTSKVVHVGNITLPQLPMYQRLCSLYTQIRDIVDTFKPTEVSLEKVFSHRNPDSLIKLAQARGVIIVAATQGKIPLFEYAPRDVKQTVTGNGGAEKEQVQLMCQFLLKITSKLPSDAADALALALTHAHHGGMLLKGKSRNKRKRGLNWSEHDLKLAGKFNRG